MWLRTARMMLLLPIVLFLSMTLAHSDAITEDAAKQALTAARADFLKEHQAPGKLVDWSCHSPQLGQDETGVTIFTMDIIGVVAGEGQDMGSLYMTQMNAYVDPETGETVYTLSDLEGGEGYDAFDFPVEDLKQYFPDGPLCGGEPLDPNSGWGEEGGNGDEGGDGDGGDEGQTVEPGGEQVAPEAPAGALPWTHHVAELQTSASELEAALETIETWPQMPADADEAVKWATDLREAGYDAVRAVDRYSFVLSEFVDPVTRAGLTTDIMLAKENAAAVVDIVSEYAKLLGYKVVKAGEEQETVRQAALRELQEQLAKKIGERFHSQGLAAVLTTDSLRAAETEARTRIHDKLKSRAEEITNRELGVPFYNVPTARAAVKHKVRQLVRQRITDLLCRITSKEIVVQFVGEILYRVLEAVIGPKVREWFRTTGNLENRVAQSTATLRTARIRLAELPAEGMLDDVRAELRRSEGTLNATNYLLKDLARAKSPLEQWYQIEILHLMSVRKLTHQRFFLDSAGELEEMKSGAQLVIALAGVLRDIVDKIEIPDAVADVGQTGGQTTGDGGGGGEDPEDPDKPVTPLITYEKPVHLYHVTKWHGPNGPVNKDYWYATSGEPAEDAPNIILVPSPYGGVEISEFSSRSGAYTTNHALMKALAGAGARFAYIGSTTISANPDP